jgi:hypothetical protein
MLLPSVNIYCVDKPSQSFICTVIQCVVINVYSRYKWTNYVPLVQVSVKADLKIMN